VYHVCNKYINIYVRLFVIERGRNENNYEIMIHDVSDNNDKLDFTVTCNW